MSSIHSISAWSIQRVAARSVSAISIGGGSMAAASRSRWQRADRGAARAFSPQSGRCFKMVYSHQPQASHCSEAPAGKASGRIARGKSWYVEAWGACAAGAQRGVEGLLSRPPWSCELLPEVRIHQGTPDVANQAGSTLWVLCEFGRDTEGTPTLVRSRP
jgi:hypothetical protein